MSNIHFIGGEKGGIGKSVLARLLAQYHIDRGLPFCAFDSDRSHGAMLRFYGDYSRPVVLDVFDSADLIMETALEQPRDVIVDLAAQTALPLFKWIDDNDLVALAAEEGVGVVFWHLMDDGADSITLLRGLLGRRDGGEELVAVRNHGRGSNFERFDRSPEHADAERKGVRLMDLPALHEATMRKVDHQAASFWAAANNSDDMRLMDRRRVKVWLRKAYAPLDEMAAALFVARADANAVLPIDAGSFSTAH
ncbi:MAG: mobilization protein [Thiohalocapsa sp.]